MTTKRHPGPFFYFLGHQAELAHASRLYRTNIIFSTQKATKKTNCLYFQTFSAMFCNFQLFLAYSSNFIFWNDWPWVCISEAVRLNGCFPLELRAFSSLTVSGVHCSISYRSRCVAAHQQGQALLHTILVLTELLFCLPP